MMATVYVVLGDPDGRLSVSGFAEYVEAALRTIETHAERVHGRWLSEPADLPSAVVAFRVAEAGVAQLKQALAAVRAHYGQRSIAWAEAQTTYFL
ncbi:hypothetical protein HII36_29795 [Nonomuraea sp. NN258]|uniref:hypothetical protein n=1 Tax=Nonomuraea antri TaxID=2730852 RepID=UPI00156A163C|nr:hypothetical protein [Nonomuraea antri]NRQ35994.1 hypothetical protein [Nonomuraea antri]